MLHSAREGKIRGLRVKGRSVRAGVRGRSKRRVRAKGGGGKEDKKGIQILLQY